MGKMKDKKKKKVSSPKVTPEIGTDSEKSLLKNVLEMGGQKDDVRLIEDISDDNEEIVMGEAEELDAEPIKKDDIKEFIKQLKIKDYRDPSFTKPEKQGKKSTVETVVEEETPVSSTETKKEKKKKGNKYKIQHDEVSSTVKDNENVDVGQLDYQKRKYLLLKTGSDWIEQSFPEDPTKFPPVSEGTLKTLRQRAQTLYDDDITMYQERKKSSKSEAGWMKTVVSSGTLGDKVAALTVMIQDAAVHTLQQLDQLLAMVKKKGKRECLLAVDNLKELFLTVWLPDNRKLRKFEEHPHSMLSELSSGNKDSRDRRLVIWYYEDLLKGKYAEFVESLEALAHDQLPAAKAKAISTVFDLLVSKPELEKRLLMVLVNKLGDPDQKIAAKSTHKLINLLEMHPNMKVVVTMEVERLLYRPNIAHKAQDGVGPGWRTVLPSQGKTTYYAVCFLNQIILSHEESALASRLISAYFSFFKSFVKKGEVDSRMMSALLSGVNRAYPYAQEDKAKLEENMNTLYQVVHVVNFNTSIQALMLIYQVTDSSAAVSDRYYTSLYRKILDPSLAHSSKQAMFLNLLFKSMKTDNSVKRIKAFMKRILQVSSMQSPTFACSTLILVAEVLKAHPGLLDLSHSAEESDDEEEERFVDVEEDDEDSEKKSSPKKSSSKMASWVHRSNLTAGHEESSSYDPHHRNPLYTCADRECIWELKKMAAHYHPTVVLFASNILQGKPIEYPGDPLQDFTLIRFLDRFVYRNPKKKDEMKAVQAKTERAPVGARALPINSEQYLSQGEAKIPADEKFFFRYFNQRAKRQAVKSRDEADDDSDVESVDDDEFDDYLDTHEGQFEGDEEIKFDFAGEFTRDKSTKKKKKNVDEESDDDVDESDEDLSDEEVDLGDLGDMDLGDDDEDEEMEDDEDIDDDEEEDGPSSEEEDDIFSHGKKSKTKPLTNPSRKRGRKDDVTSLFASAEEFSHLLEEGASSKLDGGGSHALSNVKDKAGTKQLKWEMDRDRWVRGADWRSKKKTQSGSKGRHKSKQKGKNTKKR